MRGRVIWGDISRPVNGGNVLGGVAYKNKYNYCSNSLGWAIWGNIQFEGGSIVPHIARPVMQ